MARPSKPTFFATPADFRRWLATHAATANELIVGFYKRDSGRPSITWPESVDEALCVGWIDSIRRRIDDVSYQIRFTPRRPGSTWSAINLKRFEVLEAEGRMTARGRAALAARRKEKDRSYAYEQPSHAQFEPAEESQFRAEPEAWSHFEAQAPSYRKRVLWWVTSARQATTRQSRLARLIASCRKGERL